MSTCDVTTLAARIDKAIKSARLTPAEAPPLPSTSPLSQLHPATLELIRSYLVWESTEAKAAQAMLRLSQSLVDLNDLRVCTPEDLASTLGVRYPRVEERAFRIKHTLNAIYNHTHSVCLSHLHDTNKRDAKSFLDGLDEIPLYVSSRVQLLVLGAHAAPVDSRILSILTSNQLIPDDSTAQQATSYLERAYRAGELTDVFLQLQTWADDAGSPEPAPEYTPPHLRPVPESSAN